MEARITVKIEEMGYCDEWIQRVEQNVDRTLCQERLSGNQMKRDR